MKGNYPTGHFFNSNINPYMYNPFPSPTMKTITPSTLLPSPVKCDFSSDVLFRQRMGAVLPLQPYYSSTMMEEGILPESLEETIIGGHLPEQGDDEVRHLAEALQETIINGHLPGDNQQTQVASADLTDEEREEALRKKRKEEAFKTALCDAFRRNGRCSYGEACRFAHGEQELRLPLQPKGKAHPKYKTQLCDKFSQFGWCPYGPKCQFIHKLKKGLPIVEYDRLVSTGNLSPARESEVQLVDQTPPKSGWQELRLEVPPPAMLKNRRSREQRPTKDSLEQASPMSSYQISRNDVVERARKNALERMLREVLRREEEEKKAAELRAQHARRQIESKFL